MVVSPALKKISTEEKDPRLRIGLVLTLIVLVTSASIHADPIAFPQGYIPFSSLSESNYGSVSIVVGETDTLQGLDQLFLYTHSLPSVATKQQYSNNPIELAPGDFFNGVLVPTNDERQGDFRDFPGSITNPLSGQAFTDNIIPADLLYEIFAFVIDPSAPISPVPEAGGVILAAFGIALIAGRMIWFGSR